MIVGMKTVIRCADYARSRAFYSRVMGFAVVEEWEEVQGRGCIFSPGLGLGPCLEIYQMTEADRRFQAAFGQPLGNDKVDVQLRTHSVDEWVERLRGQWDFAGPNDLPWGQTWIQLRDPDQLLIAIYQEHRS